MSDAAAKALEIIEEAEMNLEDANYHSIVEIPSEVWSIVEPFIPEEQKVDVAKKIAKVFNI